MKKTDKKTDKAIREALTEVCELALEEVVGFKWLTHFVNYQRFPSSLSIVCVFESNSDLSSALSAHKDEYLRRLIKEKLGAVDIQLKNISQHVSFDTEEACQHDNGGKWYGRFS